jgi:hypothetical protein
LGDIQAAGHWHMLVPALSVASVERQQTDIINSGDGCQAASSPDCLSGLDPL